MTKRLFAVAPFLIATPLLAQDAARAAATITEADVSRRVWIIAHDSMRGRETPSPELDLVAAHIGSEFRRFGLEPLGDGGTFLQHYDIQRTRLDTAMSTFAVDGGPTLRFGPDLVRWRGGVTAAGATGDAVLIAGTPASLSDLEALDLAGKIAIVIARTEATGQPTRDADRMLRTLAGRRPVAVIMLVDAPDDWKQGRSAARTSGMWPVPCTSPRSRRS